MKVLEAPLTLLGNAMRRHAGVILMVQWAVILFYFSLLIIPAFLPLPPGSARALDSIVLFSQFIFWGIWWPFVILSVVFFGRFWCGVFCPEGALSEWAARYGRKKGPPRWIRWAGWPTLAFAITTLYGQLVSVYDYAKPALLILGGSTIVAVLAGLLYGNSKRVWCRYLCPVSGVFSLLSRLAPLHFKVDESRWSESPEPHQPMPNCAPLVDIRRMKGSSLCHMCGRCSGQREAIKLVPRSVNEEVVVYGNYMPNPWDVRLLLYGIIGLAIGAFTWTASPWYINLKQGIAEWLVEHDIFWPLYDTAPWWLLTHYPENNDSFNWVDGFSLAFYILGSCFIIGTFLNVMLRLAAWCAGKGGQLYHHIAQSLIPLGATGLFLGLSATTVKLMRQNGFWLDWVQNGRALMLTIALLWSLTLAWKVLSSYRIPGTRLLLAFLCFATACAPIVIMWWLMFWGWSG